MKRVFWLPLVVVVGCATKSYSPWNLYDVEVVSEPPGARIEVNDDYIGDAPTTIKLKGDWSRAVWRSYYIKAYPRGQGWVQKKFLRRYTPMPKGYRKYAEPNDVIPKRMFFDTNLKPVESDVNVNINNKQSEKS